MITTKAMGQMIKHLSYEWGFAERVAGGVHFKHKQAFIWDSFPSQVFLAPPGALHMCDGYNVPGIVKIEMEKSLTSYQVVPGCLLCPGFRERNMQSHPVFHQRLCSGIQSLDHTFLGKKVAGKTVWSLCHLKYVPYNTISPCQYFAMA